MVRMLEDRNTCGHELILGSKSRRTPSRSSAAVGSSSIGCACSHKRAVRRHLALLDSECAAPHRGRRFEVPLRRKTRRAGRASSASDEPRLPGRFAEEDVSATVLRELPSVLEDGYIVAEAPRVGERGAGSPQSEPHRYRGWRAGRRGSTPSVDLPAPLRPRRHEAAACTKRCIDVQQRLCAGETLADADRFNDWWSALIAAPRDSLVAGTVKPRLSSYSLVTDEAEPFLPASWQERDSTLGFSMLRERSRTSTGLP